ncbi:hypothetical protein TSTA_105550 [Talaromyces stipitatus ATCC 10500]|uniref:Uncharacterized protein n=1 Tax=Talaromyces stipitatus (strain ATCC 10500 / CBS 375.48 / QM 6759 / NRRL 1006) TaxID=441959 RepID=B8MPA5_TALSN|nr:uncharacterized protein TSTA_105550 [Talaromyces stipitatus ATCC 10500]EED14344.1 hypothetical protein TSTA_105550 [Talaromyces stipitatus ATCC 10500]
MTFKSAIRIDLPRLLLLISSIFLAWFIWYTFYIWYIQTPIAPPSAQQKTNLPCTDANWSAGSAFFTLTALIFGYIAHPRGCLFWNRSGRIWRLSPVFALIEMDDHTDVEAEFGSNGDANEMKTLSAYRRVGHFPPGIEREYHSTCDRIFQEHLNIVGDFEKGPSFRVFVWFPMILQVIKLAVVGGPGAILTQVTGWSYFGAWLSIEILMVTISQRPLTAPERAQATSLSRRWRKSYETPDLVSYWLDRVYLWGLERLMIFDILPPATFRVTRYSGLCVAMCNFFLAWTLSSASSGGENHEPGTYLSLFECAVRALKIMALLLATVTPGLPLLAQRVLHFVWKNLRSVLWFDIGSLWFEDSLGDLEPLWPGYIAVCSYVLTFLFHSGIWWTEPFECWATMKPGYYDWLG